MIGNQIKTEWIDLLYEVVLISVKEQYIFKIAGHRYRVSIHGMLKLEIWPSEFLIYNFKL